MLAPLFKRDSKALLRTARGRLVADFLAGSWRPLPSVMHNSTQDLDEIAPLLMRSGCGSLAWSRIRQSGLQSSAVARRFQQAYRLHSLQAALHRRNLKRVISFLRSLDLEPLLVKGWAIARHYAEPGMRPYGDIDLCVSQDQYARAREALKSPDIQECNVDLHEGFGKFYDRNTDDVFARSQLIKLDDLDVRVLSREDDLRFLCLHLLRHGAVRPLWLCDIAVLLETQPAEFDWDLCLSGSRRQADWVSCTIELTHRLLGGKSKHGPTSHRAQKLPKWLLSTVLKEWGAPFKFPGQIAVYLRHPFRLAGSLLKELPDHWPNPIEATMTLKGPINELPRLPFQIGHVFSRTAALLPHLPSIVGSLVDRRS